MSTFTAPTPYTIQAPPKPTAVAPPALSTLTVTAPTGVAMPSLPEESVPLLDRQSCYILMGLLVLLFIFWSK